MGEADKVVVLCKILRIFGAADLSVARLFEGHLNAILLVSRLATADQIGQLAKDVGAGALSAVWGADDANGLQRNSGGNGWILNGCGACLMNIERAIALRNLSTACPFRCLLTLLRDHLTPAGPV